MCVYIRIIKKFRDIKTDGNIIHNRVGEKTIKVNVKICIYWRYISNQEDVIIILWKLRKLAFFLKNVK